MLISRVQASSPRHSTRLVISGHGVIGYELLFNGPQTWQLSTLWRQPSRKHSCHGEMLLLSDVPIVSIKQQREVGNYVSQAAEDNSCTAITLICSCLWGEGLSRRVTKQREPALDVYQRVKMAAANSWLCCECEWVVSVHLAFLHALPPLDDDKPGRWVGNSFPAPAYSSKILHLKDEGD